jgi:hypothetical protein
MAEAYSPAGSVAAARPARKNTSPAIEGDETPQAALEAREPQTDTAPGAVPADGPANADPVAKRIEEMRAKRKERRSVDVSGYNQRLEVPAQYKDPRFTYRWVKDNSTRLHQMKQKDWELVDDPRIAKDDRNSGIGSRIERVSDERTTHNPEKVFLMRKPKEFYDEDKGKEQARLKAQEQAIERGQVRNAEGQSEPGMYVPAGGGTKIDHGQT